MIWIFEAGDRCNPAILKRGTEAECIREREEYRASYTGTRFNRLYMADKKHHNILSGYYADGRPKRKPARPRLKDSAIADYLNWAIDSGLAEVTLYPNQSISEAENCLPRNRRGILRYKRCEE